jgi:hypothetical protein
VESRVQCGTHFMAGAQVLQRMEKLCAITRVLYYRVRVTCGTVIFLSWRPKPGQSTALNQPNHHNWSGIYVEA